MTSPSVPKKVAIAGPAHPYTGGIAQHTTRLALELERHGLDVTVESWKSQYPRWLRPGRQQIEHTEPEIGIPSRVRERLTWYNPISWWLAGKRSREADLLVLSIPTPWHAVVYIGLLAGSNRRPLAIGLVHNVLPHESGRLDQWLISALFTRLDRIVVHSSSQSELAQSLGASANRIRTTPLPSPWPAKVAPIKGKEMGLSPQALFFGTIRPYKGLDLLIEALRDVPEVTLLIAGEFWQDENLYRQRIASAGLENRVSVLPGYVESKSLESVFGQADFLVLPYRSGTSSIVKNLAFRFGLPVVASTAGAIADGIQDDVHGALVAPGDVGALRAALRRAANPSTLARWTAEVRRAPSPDKELWERYCRALLD